MSRTFTLIIEDHPAKKGMVLVSLKIEGYAAIPASIVEWGPALPVLLRCLAVTAMPQAMAEKYVKDAMDLCLARMREADEGNKIVAFPSPPPPADLSSN